MDIAFLVSYGALWLLVCVDTLVLLGLVHAVHRLSIVAQNGSASFVSADGRSTMIGQQLPPFQVIDVHGLRIDSNRFRGRNTVLLFVSPSCPGCARALDDLTLFERRGEVIVLCRGDNGDCEQMVKKHSLRVPVALDADSRVSNLLHINALPTAVVVDKNGRIGSYGDPHVDAEAPTPVGVQRGA